MSSDDQVNRILDRLEDVAGKLAEVVGDIKLLADRQINQSNSIDRLQTALDTERNARMELASKVDKWINRGWGAWGVVVALFTAVTALGWKAPPQLTAPAPAAQTTPKSQTPHAGP